MALATRPQMLGQQQSGLAHEVDENADFVHAGVFGVRDLMPVSSERDCVVRTLSRRAVLTTLLRLATHLRRHQRLLSIGIGNKNQIGVIKKVSHIIKVFVILCIDN